ncbi:MAG: PEGA domain-containing protein [Planctomycetes bacterium]|nr:PEGA domain-containing protein [Planctomycetota bacterium]
MRPFAVLSLLAASACTWFTSKSQVVVTSEPPGARILIDGIDTGHTTPAALQIGGSFGRDHVLELRLAGHRPAVRRFHQYTEGYTSKWIDGAYDPVMPPLPFFWTFGDFVFPFAVRGAMVPGEVYVKLYREDEPLLGFELLAARAAGTAGAREAPPQ